MNKPVASNDPFNARVTFETGNGKGILYRLNSLEDAGFCRLADLPYSIKVLLESVLRNCDGFAVTERDVKNMAGWNAAAPAADEIPFKPSRVVLQDFTGVPAVVDLAAMRGAMQRLGGKPSRINPLIPVDLVIDHSVQVDYFGSDDALEKNVAVEYERNQERYEFLRWGQQAFDNFRAIPPNVGIVHQVNLEYLARVVWTSKQGTELVAYPDTLVGTDSHTTMINGLGVLGWGVGGIEAEAAMLGQPLYMLMPEVIGMEVTGKMPRGTTATDLVLRVTEVLRKEGVVNKFVEFYGAGVSTMSLADRATIANMAPEYGATMGYFPVDAETLRYLRKTGRPDDLVQLVERYCKEQGLFRNDGSAPAKYTKTLKLDLSSIEPCLAGPKRPQDRVPLSKMKETFHKSLRAPINERGFGVSGDALERKSEIRNDGKTPVSIQHGAVVIAAITSCTNTSNPSVMLGAGLLAKKAVARGLKVPSYVKTSLAPGSRVVTEYLDRAGVSESLRALGFHVVGYGCTTCIGNSGPLPQPVADAVVAGDLVAAAVLSGNRNFEGRVNPHAKANYLASPPLVVAYALAGTTDIDLTTEALGMDSSGKPVFLHEIWPTSEEIDDLAAKAITPDMFREQYGKAVQGDSRWQSIKSATGEIYQWDLKSTYIQEPPFLADVTLAVDELKPLKGARVLALLGDSVTTDHISPASSITKDGPAGRYLQSHGVPPREFNSYGSRRGNDRVMVRGTFANIRIRNHVAPGTEGGWTKYLPTGEVISIYDAALKYGKDGTPLIVIAGSEYGTGSSRDWAAKGTLLLGVRAVIATSYERIHRSNLVGMGVLPLEFKPGTTWQSLGLTGEETIEVLGLNPQLLPRSDVTVRAVTASGTVKDFVCTVRIDTPVEMEYYRHGGILPAVLRKLAAENV